jgi:hypothetical protein
MMTSSGGSALIAARVVPFDSVAAGTLPRSADRRQTGNWQTKALLYSLVSRALLIGFSFKLFPIHESGLGCRLTQFVDHLLHPCRTFLLEVAPGCFLFWSKDRVDLDELFGSKSR